LSKTDWLHKIGIMPPLPEQHARILAQKLNDRQLVLFVGAGISHQSLPKTGSRRLPLWHELALEVASLCNENPNEFTDLLDLFDTIVIHNDRFKLENTVRSILDDMEFEVSTVHQKIARIPWYRIYTTNYDRLLERSLGLPRTIADEQGYEFLSLPDEEQPRIFHLHGTLDAPHTLSREDYQLWAENHPRAFGDLQQILLNKTVLFVGYSFSDPHLRDGLLPLVRRIKGSRRSPHYAWMWKLPQNHRLLLQHRDGIEAISFERDDDWPIAFDQLQRVSSQISKRSRSKNRHHRTNRANVSENSSGNEIFRSTMRINAFKLFYFRMTRKLSFTELAKCAQIDRRLLRRLEQVNEEAEPSPTWFPVCDREVLRRIETVLGCAGKLEVGRSDDFLTQYMLFYQTNKGRSVVSERSLDQLEIAFETKHIILDFDGTMTVRNENLTTWEKLWVSVGYSVNDCAKYFLMFRRKDISHQRWCDITCKELRAKGFSRRHLEEITKNVQLLPGTAETIEKIKSRGINLYILSGSIKPIIVKALGNLMIHFDEIRANEIKFDQQGIVSEIIGTPFDFEAKAAFIRRVIQDHHCRPMDILFVGNSCNDVWASESGARTLCVNPRMTDPSNEEHWTYCIARMENFGQILEYVRI
jgi:HAD superfamily phosphoserine phosphatase-like hydrolase